MRQHNLAYYSKIVLSGILFLSAFLIVLLSMQKRKIIFRPRAISKIETKVQTICSDSGNAVIEVKVTNNEDKPITVLATDSQTGSSVNLGEIKPGQRDGGFIKTGKSTLNSGTIKFLVEWSDKSASNTVESNYESIVCNAQPTRSKIRPILSSDCQQDTWTITGYDPSFPLDQVDQFMVEIDGKTYDSLFPTGTWRGKNEIFFWIHVFLKNGDRFVMDADLRKECKPVSTPTPTPTPTSEITIAPTPTRTPTPTPTPVSTSTPTLTPTNTPTPTVTPTRPPGSTNTPTPISTSTATPTATKIPTATPTTLQANTPTPSEIILALNSPTPGSTAPPTAVTEIPPAGIGKYFTLFSLVSLGIIIVGLIF